LINSIRLGEEISQVQFAKILGVSRQQLCDIEHDRKIVSPKLAAKYADILGYPSSQFIRRELQSIVDRDNLDVTVDIHFRNTKKQSNSNKSSTSIVQY
jgi:transcriptional regulator with XRE-family HTH domain